MDLIIIEIGYKIGHTNPRNLTPFLLCFSLDAISSQLTIFILRKKVRIFQVSIFFARKISIFGIPISIILIIIGRKDVMRVCMVICFQSPIFNSIIFLRFSVIVDGFTGGRELFGEGVGLGIRPTFLEMDEIG